MYRVKLTEKEIKEVGVNRYIAGKRLFRIVTFMAGIVALFVGAYFWGFTAGKVWMILSGTVWIGYLFYQARRETRAGRDFVGEVKLQEKIKK